MTPAVTEPRTILNQPKRHGGTLDKASIAELSCESINTMTSEELVRVVRAAELPVLLRADLNSRLPFCDPQTLKRLAHVARRCCRNQGY